MGTEYTRNTSVIRIALVDPHPVVAAGIHATLTQLAELQAQIVAVASSVDALLSPKATPSDIALVEPGHSVDPWGSLARLSAQHRAVMVYTADERPIVVAKALAAGASGAVFKSEPMDQLMGAITVLKHEGDRPYLSPAVMAATQSPLGQVILSDRQTEILNAIALGLPYRSIAKELDISVASVREHLRRAAAAYRRSGVEPGNSHGLVARARRDGNLSCCATR